MNVSTVLVCIVAGVLLVIQAGLNRKISAVWGISPAILLNGLTLCVAASLTIWIASRSSSSFAELIGPKAGASIRPVWWYFIPGLLGFAALMSMPDAIARIGATQVFVLIVLGQLAAGLLWDRFVEGADLGLWRFVGVALVFIGAWVSTIGR